MVRAGGTEYELGLLSVGVCRLPPDHVQSERALMVDMVVPSRNMNYTPPDVRKLRLRFNALQLNTSEQVFHCRGEVPATATPSWWSI